MYRIPLPSEMFTETFEATDGTTIAYRVYNPERKQTVVLCSGIGCHELFFYPLYPVLFERFRVVFWDYRACGDSDTPPRDRLRVVDHVDDLERLFDVAGIAGAHFVGLSMGMHVTLEFYRRHKDKVRSIISCNGTCGHALQNLFRLPRPSKTVDRTCRVLIGLGPVIQPLARGFLKHPMFPTFARTLGFFKGNYSHVGAALFCERLAEIETAAYLATALEIDRASSADVLPRVSVPALIIAGERDAFVPAKVAREMAHSIPDSELWIIPGTGHAGMIEHGDEYAHLVQSFYEKIGAGRAVAEVTGLRRRKPATVRALRQVA